jgi:hypothetical protein
MRDVANPDLDRGRDDVVGLYCFRNRKGERGKR